MKKHYIILAMILFIFLCSLFTAHCQTWQEMYDSTSANFDGGNWKAAVEWGEKMLETARKEIIQPDSNLHKCLNKMSEIYLDFCEYKKALMIAKEDSTLCKNIYINDSPEFASCLNRLGVIYTQMYNYTDAEPILKRGMEIMKKFYGEKHPQYAKSLYSFASLYFYMKKYEDVETTINEVINIQKDQLGEDNTEYAKSLEVLGVLYISMSKYNDAELILKNVLMIQMEQLGKIHPDYAHVTNNLGVLYFNMKKFNDAESAFQEAVSIRKEQLGEENVDYAVSLSNLGAVNIILKNYDVAESFLKDAVRIKHEILGDDNTDYASSLNNLGALYIKMEKYEDAEPILIEVVKIRKEQLGENDIDYASSLNNLGALYIKMKKYEDAEPILKEAVRIRKEQLGEEHDDYVTSMNNLGILYFNTRQYKETESIIKKSHKIFKIKYGDNYSGCFINNYILAYIYLFEEKIPESKKYLNRCIEILKSTKNEANAENLGLLVLLAKTYYRLGYEDEYENINDEISKINDQYFQIDDLSDSTNLEYEANIFTEIGKFEEAEIIYRRLVEINIKYGDEHPDYLRSLEKLAIFYNRAGKYNEAENLLTRILLKKEKIYTKDSKEYITSMKNLAFIYNTKGLYPEADDIYDYIIKAYENKKYYDYDFYVNCLDELAELYSKMGQYADQERILLKMINIIELENKRENLEYFKALVYLSILYFKQGKTTEADPLWLNSIGILKKSNFGTKYNKVIEELLNIPWNITNLSELVKISEMSINLTRNLKGDYHPDYALSLKSFAGMHAILGQYSVADTLFKNSLRLLKETLGEEHPEYANCLSDIAELYWRMGKFDEAKQYFKECIERTFNLTDRYFKSLSEKEKLMFWEKLKERTDQFNLFVTEYFNKEPSLLRDMYNNCLITKGIVLESTKKSIRKARDLKKIIDGWQESRELWLKLSQNPLIAKQKGINIDSVENAVNEYEKMLSSQSLDFRKTFDTTKVRWYDVQSSLKKDEAAVEIIRFYYWDVHKIDTTLQEAYKRRNDTVYYAALILRGDNKEKIDYVIMENGNELETIYLGLNNKQIQIQKQRNFDIVEDRRIFMDLYSQFWKKIDERLDGIKTAYVSSDGIYNLINLNTLINPETGNYLIDEIKINMVTSTRDLSERSKFKIYREVLTKSEKRAVLFGDPKFRLESKEKNELKDTTDLNEEKEFFTNGTLYNTLRGKIDRLPGTRLEIDTITKEFFNHGWTADKFIEEEASEDSIKTLESPNVLHLATHGVFMEDIKTSGDLFSDNNKERNIENPLLRSALLFAGADNTISPSIDSTLDGGSLQSEYREDGILTAYEVMNLDLDNTELVVLSACKTGLGDIKNGEGVFGLQRAFQVAGAKSIIMSLWSVNDETTQELMISFYKKWLSGTNMKDAFRNAQSELKEKYTYPYFWGAFVMVGE